MAESTDINRYIVSYRDVPVDIYIIYMGLLYMGIYSPTYMYCGGA